MSSHSSSSSQDATGRTRTRGRSIAVQQATGEHAQSKRDYEAADKAIDILDLSHGTADTVGRMVFSDDVGRYVAPPYEKILLNVFNMLNYLETGDLNGARIEARRMVVSSRFLRERHGGNDRSLGFGSLLAGFTFEKSGVVDEARRFYDDANRVDPAFGKHWGADVPPGFAEVLIVVGDGRVPHRIAERENIGLALSRAAPHMSQRDSQAAAKLQTQALLTWVAYPTLAPPRPRGPAPTALLDGKSTPLSVTALDVEGLVRDEWKKIEGQVMAAAISRAVARIVLGKAVEQAGGKKGKGIALLASIILQAAMTAADTPDTRSWETLPARISLARVIVPAGEHTVRLDVAGMSREHRFTVEPDGFRVVSLLSLR